MRLAITIALLLTTALPAVADDVTLEQKTVTKHGEHSREVQQKVYYGKDKFATHMTGKDLDYLTIYRFDKKLVWQIDLRAKTYTERTFEQQIAELKQVQDRMKASLASTKKMLADPRMPEASKAAMRAALKTMEPKYTVAKGATGKVAGYDCVEYILSNHGKEMSRMWCTEALNIPNQYNDVFGQYSQMKDVLKDMKGVALKTVSGYSTTDTTNVVKGAIDAKVFELPAGLTKK